MQNAGMMTKSCVNTARKDCCALSGIGNCATRIYLLAYGRMCDDAWRCAGKRGRHVIAEDRADYRAMGHER